jgi:hypothetical protein
MGRRIFCSDDLAHAESETIAGEPFGRVGGREEVGAGIRAFDHVEGVGDEVVSMGGAAGGVGNLEEVLFGKADFEFEFDEEALVMPAGVEEIDDFFSRLAEDGDFFVGAFDLAGTDISDPPGFIVWIVMRGPREDCIGGDGLVVGDGGGHEDGVVGCAGEERREAADELLVRRECRGMDGLRGRRCGGGWR